MGDWQVAWEDFLLNFKGVSNIYTINKMYKVTLKCI